MTEEEKVLQDTIKELALTLPLIEAVGDFLRDSSHSNFVYLQKAYITYGLEAYKNMPGTDNAISDGAITEEDRQAIQQILTQI